MYNWRSGFVARAVWVLETAIAAKFGPQPAVTTVREWIGKMSSKTGPAFWQKPATAKVCYPLLWIVPISNELTEQS